MSVIVAFFMRLQGDIANYPRPTLVFCAFPFDSFKGITGGRNGYQFLDVRFLILDLSFNPTTTSPLFFRGFEYFFKSVRMRCDSNTKA